MIAIQQAGKKHHPSIARTLFWPRAYAKSQDRLAVAVKPALALVQALLPY